MIIYYSVILISIIFAVYAEKKNSKFAMVCSILLLSLLSGLRGENVATDTQNYIRIFNGWANGGESNMDIGFVLVSKALLAIFGKAYQPLFLIYAIITNALIVSRLWSMRKYCSFGVMYFMYVAVFYPQSMNIIRQYLALAIVFYATKFIEERKYAKYCIWNLVAVLFHLSSATGFVILILWLLIIDRHETKRKLWVVVLLICSIPIIFAAVILIYTRYSGYVDSTSAEFSLLIVGRIVGLLFFLFLRLLRGSPVAHCEEPANYTRYITCLYSLGILISTAGFVFEFVGRLSFYFLIFEIPFTAVAAFKEKNFLLKICYLTLALYFLVIKIGVLGENGIMPYTMFMFN